MLIAIALNFRIFIFLYTLYATISPLAESQCKSCAEGLLPLCCGHTCYDALTSICCSNSHLYSKTGAFLPACCGDKLYDMTFELCCNAVVNQKRGVFPACCNTQSHDLWTTSCCDGALCLRPAI